MENCPNCLKEVNPLAPIIESSNIQFYGCENCNVVWKCILNVFNGGDGKMERFSTYEDYLKKVTIKMQEQIKELKKLPVINDKEINLSLVWFLEAVRAIDRTSYSCSGILNKNETDALAFKILKMDIVELQKFNK